MTIEIGEFHWTHGVYFKRNADGSVRLRIADGEKDIVNEAIPAAEWASITSHVSVNGEPASYGEALALHQGPPTLTVYVDDQPVRIAAHSAAPAQIAVMAGLSLARCLTVEDELDERPRIVPLMLEIVLRDGMRFESAPREPK